MDNNKPSGTREIELRDKCNRCSGRGGWINYGVRIFEICSTCEGVGRLPFNPTEEQNRHQELWRTNGQ